MGEFERRRRRLRHSPAVPHPPEHVTPPGRPGSLDVGTDGPTAVREENGRAAPPVAQTSAIADLGDDAPAVAEPLRQPGTHAPTAAHPERRSGAVPQAVSEPERATRRPGDVPAAAESQRQPGAGSPVVAGPERRPGDDAPVAGGPERPAGRPGGGTAPRRGAGARPTSGAGAGGFDDRDAERGLRGLVGSGSSQVSVGAAMRARDAARPTDADLADAEERLVIVRRNWLPREDLPRNR